MFQCKYSTLISYYWISRHSKPDLCAFLLRNFQIFINFLQQFWIQSCPDAKSFFRIRIQIRILLKVSDLNGSGSTNCTGYQGLYLRSLFCEIKSRAKKNPLNFLQNRYRCGFYMEAQKKHVKLYKWFSVNTVH